MAVISLKVALFGLFYRTTLVSCKIWSGSTESYTENMEGNDWATQLKWSMGGVKKSESLSCFPMASTAAWLPKTKRACFI